MKWLSGAVVVLVSSLATASPIPQSVPQSYDTRQEQQTLYQLRVQAQVEPPSPSSTIS